MKTIEMHFAGKVNFPKVKVDNTLSFGTLHTINESTVKRMSKYIFQTMKLSHTTTSWYGHPIKYNYYKNSYMGSR